MGNRYTKEKGIHSEFDGDTDEYAGELIDREETPTLFHIGQSYEKKPARKLFCTQCGSDQFYVGQGSYYTAIRCPNCGWEICVHEG